MGKAEEPTGELTSQVEDQADELEIEDPVTDQDERVSIKRYSISSYGADYPVDGLVKRMRSKDIFIPPFQRQYVWTLKLASRFIESLLLGLPVPSIFLSRESPSAPFLVIDGQQRLRSLEFFCDGIFQPSGREFRLNGVQDEFQGRTYSTLEEGDQRTLDNSIIHAIIVRQEEPTEDNSSVYHVFERLNTGGKQLTPQEIRACMYHGPYVDLLQDLNRESNWRVIFGRQNPDNRMRDQELILRFLALFFDSSVYEKPLKDFLNKHLARNRHLQRHGKEPIRKVFQRTVGAVNAAVGRKAFRPKRALVAGFFDAFMVATAKYINGGEAIDDRVLTRISNVHQALVEDKDFVRITGAGTSDTSAVRNRMERATAAFDNVS